MRRWIFLAVALAVAAPASVAQAQKSRPAIVGGKAIAIEAAPWQVLLAMDFEGSQTLCGGSIISETRILTAAHCVTRENSNAPMPLSAVSVLAGYTNFNSDPPPRDSQRRAVKALGVHPYYEPTRWVADLAILDLDKPLNLRGKSARAIKLAPPLQPPAPGAVLSYTGYGQSTEGQLPTGPLNQGTAAAISDDQCRSALDPTASGTAFCVTGGPPTVCYGDSGGPLIDAQGQLVGVTSFVPGSGCGKGPAGFADLAAPEIRAFIDGNPTPPKAPRPSTPPGLAQVLRQPVVGSPIKCLPGGWSDTSGGIGYAFINDNDNAVLQGGPGDTFVPGPQHVGARVACSVGVTNAGGVAWSRSPTAPVIGPDAVAPRLRLRSIRCKRRRCTVRLIAADPNSLGALTVRATAKKLSGRKRARKRVAFTSVRAGTKYRYRVRSPRLRRGRTRITVRVIDAAGNKSRGAIRRTVRVR